MDTIPFHWDTPDAPQCLLGQVCRPGECHGNFPTPKNGNYSKAYGDGIGAIIPRIAKRTKKQPAVKQPVVNFGRTPLEIIEPLHFNIEKRLSGVGEALDSIILS